MTPGQLLVVSRDVVGGKKPGMRGLWARAAALLTRQALEGGLAHLWRYRAPSLERANFTTQLLCLPHRYVRNGAGAFCGPHLVCAERRLSSP